MRWISRSEIHKATVTEADLDYVGSITIDEDLIGKVGFMQYEKVLLVDNTNGARLETYATVGGRGFGTICMNGATAYLIKTVAEIIIMGFELSDKPIKPKNILVDKNNKFVKCL